MRRDETSLEVAILSRKDCHLCEVVESVARQVQTEFSFTLTRIDIDEYPELATHYGNRIPVVLINQKEAFSGGVTIEVFRQAVKKAQQRGPVSRILSRLRSTLQRG